MLAVCSARGGAFGRVRVTAHSGGRCRRTGRM